MASGKGEQMIIMNFKQGGQEFTLLIPAECKNCVLNGVAAPPPTAGTRSSCKAGVANKLQRFSARDLKSK